MIQIYDPLSTTPARGRRIRAHGISGNVIPANRINPVAARCRSTFLAPNAAGNPITGVNNFSRNDGNSVHKDTVSVRGDHYFSEKNRLFSRFSYDDTPFIRAAPYGREQSRVAGHGPASIQPAQCRAGR